MTSSFAYSMSSGTAKPTIILVPGAWHPASCWDLVASGLQSHGYRTVQVTTPTVGNVEIPYRADVQAIRNAITSAGEDVLLVMHSYGAVPGCCAVESLRREDLGEGKGGVVGLVFCTAWMLDVGECILENSIVYSAKARAVSDDPIEVWKPRGGAAEVFYNDLPKAEQEKRVAMLKHHKQETILRSIVTYAAWRHVPSTYLLCSLDKTIVYETQQGMVERAQKEGVDLKTEVLEAGHSPFLSKPEAVVEAIRRAAGEAV